VSVHFSGAAVEDARELPAFGGEFRELKRAPRLEPDEEDALAVLRHDALRVDDLLEPDSRARPRGSF